MKELPVKIWAYIGPHLGLIQANGCFPVGAPGEKEYIQKDALLEWAQENQEKCFSIVEDDLWQEVIDKINSL